MKKFFKDMKYIFLYAWKIDKLYLLLRIPFTLLEALTPLITVIFPALIVEDITIYLDYTRVWRHVLYMVGLLAASHVVQNILNMVITNRFNLFEYKHTIVLGKKIMTVEFPKTESAEVLNLVERIHRIEYIEGSFAAMFSFVANAITITGLLWILSNVNLFIIITIAVAVILNVYFNNISENYNYQWQQETAPYRRRADYLHRLMYGFQYGKEVRVNGLERYLTDKYNVHSKEYLAKLKKVTIKFMNINHATSLIGVVQLAIVYLSLANAVLSKGITIASFTKYISAVNSLTESLMGLSNVIVELKNNFNYVQDLRDFLSLESEKEKENNLPVPCEDFTIEFRDVSFKYPNTDRYVLKNINVSISPNTQIAIVGLNGSGKTTFVKLMLRLYKPTSGAIYINGIDINSFDFKEYIDNFACAFQDFRMFSYSVKENIFLCQPQDEEKLKNVVKQCGIYETICQLPRGFDTPIFKFLDDEGVEFSGGEGQKIIIARALYKQAKVVILDEPLAALDPIAEYDMYQTLSKMIKNRTCIFISHRLSLTQSSDLILVFNQGEIVETGTHAELINLKNGMYAEMYQKQAMFYNGTGEELNEE